MRLSRRAFAGALMGASLLSGAASAQTADNYPSRPIHLIIPYQPGSATDTGGRIVAGALTSILGQNVIVENRGGASGTIGTTFASKAAPDGYTIALGNTATHGSPKELSPDLPYDPLESFTPISTIYRNILGLAVSTSFPASTFDEFITYVKANPGKVNYGIPGYGTVQQLAAMILSQKAGLSMQQIPYQGGGPAMKDLVGGHLPVTFTAMASAAPFLQDKKIKVLAILGKERVSEFSDIPTVAEKFPGFDYAGWGGFFAPKGTDKAIVAKLNAAIKKAYEDPKVTDALNKVGLEPLHSTPEELTERTRLLLDGWAQLAASGVQIKK